MKYLNKNQVREITTFYYQSGGNETRPTDIDADLAASIEAEKAERIADTNAEREETNAEILNSEFKVMTGKEYAEKKEIVLEQALEEGTFKEIWNERLEAQKKEGFNGMYIPEDLYDQVWDYVQHTFEAKGSSGDTLKNKVTEAIEKEALFFKMLALDNPVPKNPDGTPQYTFPGGFLTEGDYIDHLAQGDPNDAKDDIDPELLAYLRASNALGLGFKHEQGGNDLEGLEKRYEATLERLRKFNIQNLSALRENLGKLGDNPTPAQAAQVLRDGTVDPSRVESNNGEINTLWDLIRIILEFATGKKYSFSNNDRVSGDEISGELPNGNGEATPAFAQQALDQATGTNKAILAKALEAIGVSESGNAGLIREMHACAGLNAGPGTPWCASFISWVLQKAGIDGPKTASSREFLNHGTAISPGDAQPGDLCIFSRGSGGHVGVFVGWDRNRKPIIVGGNQSNRVSVKSSRQNLIGIRRIG